MSLKDISFEEEYRSLENNMVQDFYVPLLSEAVSYKRSVGYFSSSALLDLSKGIAKLAKNGGHIYMIASPHLSQEDIDAVRRGYAERDTVIEKAILKELDVEYTDYFSLERLNLLANLIASGTMEFQVAFLENESGIGMYHEKMGIIEDSEGNKVAFSGSNNESDSGIQVNYETTDVFSSWNEPSRTAKKERAFDNFWEHRDRYVKTIRFPNIEQAIFDKYKRGPANFNIDDEQFPKREKTGNHFTENKIGPQMPDGIELYDYQRTAIQRWAEENYRGIFNMATGSGKTLTGLGAVTRLFRDIDDKLAVFIVCPYQHLVEQWVEDIVKFNISPIIAYGQSPQKDWKTRLNTAIRSQKLRGKERPFFCCVCTNATFRNKSVQELINKTTSPILLLVDEAHNAGAETFLQVLDDRFTYRLALSATMDRHMDEEGTTALYNFFGQECIRYSLDDAIRDGKLTPYKYHVIPVCLTEDELRKYKQYSIEMARNMVEGKGKKRTLNRYGKMIAIKRARVVAAAEEKINALKETIEPYKDDNNLLIYCGATDMLGDDEDYTKADKTELRQIDAVTDMLRTEYGMLTAQFTSKENMTQRGLIKKAFVEGNVQALVAIKCLDEGVNIPGIRTAFILASTTNPKEYIQRRGRVLRRADGKKFAEIYDFITLPRPLEEASVLPKDLIKGEAGLIKNEIRRMKEFSRSAMIKSVCNDLIWEMQEAYGLTDADLEYSGDDEEGDE